MVKEIFTKSLTTNKRKFIRNTSALAGLGFLLVGALSLIYSFVVREYFPYILYEYDYKLASGIVLGILLIAIICMRMFWSFSPQTASPWLIAFTWIFSCIAYTGMLAPLITLLNNAWMVLGLICVTGLVFLLLSLVGLFVVNAQTAFTLSIFVTIVSILMLVGMLIYSLVIAFTWRGDFQTYNIIVNSVYTVLIGLTTILSFYRIAKVAEAYEYMEDRTIWIKLTWFYGLEILNMIVVFVVLVLNGALNFKNL